MPILAFNSTSILDSTSIGRDLLTAADQAAAQAAIGVTPFDVDADHDWGGFNTFEFLATFEGGINTNAITSNANIVTTMPSGGQGQYYFGANPIYLMSATEFRPAEALTSAALGSDTRRWTDVYSVDGSFTGNLVSEVGGSYRLYNLGDESATDREYLDISATANVYKIAPLRTGAGAVRQFRLEGGFGPGFGNIFFDAFGFVNLAYGQTPSISIRGDGAELLKDMFPNVTKVDTLSLGKSDRRFGEFYSVDGDFSGTLKTEGFKTGVAATTQAAITLSDTDHTLLADCTNNNVVVSLPASAGNDGLQYTIKKVDGSANYCSVTPNGAETIDGQSSFTITGQYESVSLVCYSGEWYLV